MNIFVIRSSSEEKEDKIIDKREIRLSESLTLYLSIG